MAAPNDVLPPIAFARWFARVLCERRRSRLLDLAAERTSCGSTIYAEYKALAMARSALVRDAAAQSAGDSAAASSRIATALSRQWDRVIEVYTAHAPATDTAATLEDATLSRAARLELVRRAAASLMPAASAVAHAAAASHAMAPPPERRTTTRSLAVAPPLVAPTLPRLGSSGDEHVGLLTSLDRGALDQLLACIRTAMVDPLRVEYLTGNRVATYLRKADMEAATARYALAVREQCGIDYKLNSVFHMAARPVPLVDIAAVCKDQDWHQDDEEGVVRDTVDIAIALTHILPENGPMEFEWPFKSGKVWWSAAVPAGSSWMFRQEKQRHRGSLNRGTHDRCVLFLGFKKGITLMG